MRNQLNLLKNLLREMSYQQFKKRNWLILINLLAGYRFAIQKVLKNIC